MDSGRSPHSVVAALVDDLTRLQATGRIDGFDSVMNDWAALQFDPTDVSTWTPDQAHAGLAELERIRRSLAAVTVELANRLGAGRDTQAAVCRATNS